MAVGPAEVAPLGRVPHAFAVGPGVPLSLCLLALHTRHYGGGL